MKTNLVYIITLVTIVIALNYIHIHTDPYPAWHNSLDEPFFLSALQQSSYDLAQSEQQTIETITTTEAS